MLNINWPRVLAWLGGGLVVTFVAVFLGLMSALAPVLAILLSILIVTIGILVGAYAWARRVAMGNGQLALYLLLFWVWVVNMPAIMAFDTSGITKPDLFNPQSIGRIIMFFLVGLGFVFNYFNTSRRQAAAMPKLGALLTLPLLIYGWYLVDVVLVSGGQDLVLALYRIAEWVLLLFLIVAVVGRAPVNPAERENWLLRVVFAMLLFMLLITLVMLPIVPNWIYLPDKSGLRRLQNPFAHPNTLGVLAGMAFFYFLERKPRFFRLGLLLAFGMMVATYSRGAWAGFTLATAFYLLLRPRTMQGRFFAAMAMIFVTALAWATQDFFIDSVERFLARGGSVTSLATASERTEVWQASRVLIREAPLLGHGYITGPKKLNDIMATGPSASYFRAVNAHNEFVQTQINGGIIATILLAIFLARTLYLLKALARSVSPHFFRCVTAWIIMIWTFGMLSPNISGQLLIVGALLLYLHTVLELLYADKRAAASTAKMTAQLAAGAKA
ncbi:MAG: O-antigen ligase family protein [Thiobacillus sp.]